MPLAVEAGETERSLWASELPAGGPGLGEAPAGARDRVTADWMLFHPGMPLTSCGTSRKNLSCLCLTHLQQGGQHA